MTLRPSWLATTRVASREASSTRMTSSTASGGMSRHVSSSVASALYAGITTIVRGRSVGSIAIVRNGVRELAPHADVLPGVHRAVVVMKEAEQLEPHALGVRAAVGAVHDDPTRRPVRHVRIGAP